MAVRQNTKQIFVTILVPAKTVISRPPPANHSSVSGPRDGVWTNGRGGQMADDHLGRFIYFYFLFMSGSNQGVCHMVIVWEGGSDTAQDICQYQELSPCYPQTVHTGLETINLWTSRILPSNMRVRIKLLQN